MQSSNRVRQIFLSYASRDRDRALALARRLRQEPGLKVFVSDDDLAVGDDIGAKMRSALRDSDAIVALVTRSYLESDWTGAELGAAWMLDKPVVAVVEDPRFLERLPEGLALSRTVALEPQADDEVVASLQAA